MNKKMYRIYLPDNKTYIVIWFIGKQIKKILDAYNIKYEILEGDNNE